jgi:hypothetical protein
MLENIDEQLFQDDVDPRFDPRIQRKLPGSGKRIGHDIPKRLIAVEGKLNHVARFAHAHALVYALTFQGEDRVKIGLGIALSVVAIGSPAAAEIGRVKSSTGNAYVVRAGASTPARPGLPLEPQDQLVTKKDGRLAITFIDNTRFALGPNSNVSVRQFVFDRKTRSGQFDALVNRGSLAVVSGQIAKSGQDAMKVRTPTTVLGVRGTRFVVNVR